MIIAEIKDANLHYGLNENIEKAFRYIETTDLLNLANGRYEINGDDVFAVVQDYQTKPYTEGNWEAHKKYVDIQYIITGREKIGCGTVGNFSAVTDYDSEKDIFFLKGDGDFSLLNEGYFAIITPEFAHMPSISAGKSSEYVKKLVVKVKDWR